MKGNARRRWNYGFGSIILRKTKEGKDRWSIHGRDGNGRFREVVKDAQTRGEALVALQHRVAKSFNGRLNPARRAEPMRFSRLAEIYLEDYAKANKKSWICDSYALRAHLVPYFGGSKLGEITPLMIEQYRNERLQSVCRSSTNRETALLKVMLNLAITWGFASENPVLKVKQYSEKDNLKERVLTEGEEERILAAIAPHLRPFIIGLLATGARLNELMALRWESVDLKRETILLTKTKAGRNRVIPINARFREVLTGLKAVSKCDRVFTGAKGQPIRTVRNAFVNACRRAGLEGLRMHDLRHTFASRLIERGVDIVTVKELLGHHSVTVTERYTHSNGQLHRAAVDLLAQGRGTLAQDRQMEPAAEDEPPVTRPYSVH